ncbi:MAG: hypothetical protein J6T10_20910 [Methanobrevibacter sp.]|nr:hypothetical protein [Methanobrevibacter sp.]
MTKRDKILKMSEYNLLVEMQNNMCRLKAIHGHTFCIIDVLEGYKTPCIYDSCEKCIAEYLNEKE